MKPLYHIPKGHGKLAKVTRRISSGPRDYKNGCLETSSSLVATTMEPENMDTSPRLDEEENVVSD